MANLNIDLLINDYDDFYFSRAKAKFAEHSANLSKIQNSKVVDALLSTLFSDNIIDSVTPEQFSNIIKSLFDEKIIDSRVILKYMDSVYKIVSDVKGINFSGRAAKYHDYMRDGFLNKIRDRKNEIHFSDDEEILLFLTDYLKIALALYNIPCPNGAFVSLNIASIDERPSEEKTFAFTQAFFNLIDNLSENDGNSASEPGQAGFPIKGLQAAFAKVQYGVVQAAENINNVRVNVINEHELSNSDKQLYFVITWLLYYRICQEDQLIPGGSKDE